MSVLSSLAGLVGKRRRTRVYDSREQIDFVAYLEEYMSPVGTIISKLSSKTPGDAWVMVNGQSLLKKDYGDLYADIGGQFGETATTFNLPNLSNTYLTGVGTLGVGAIGGGNSVSLLITQIPAHKHPLIDPGHTHTFTGLAHGHGVTDPGHAHGTTELAHNHAITDPSHSHAITDGGHTHASGIEGGLLAAAGVDVAVAATGNTGSAATGVTVDASPTGLTLSPASTGLAVNSGPTGVSVDNTVATGSNSTAQTDMTMGNSGGGLPIDNRPASIGVYHFIKTRI